MKASKRIFSLIFLISLLSACNNFHNPVSTTSQQYSKYSSATSGTDLILSSNEVPDVVHINNYNVKFTGKTYDANTNQSTFSYTVYGTGVEPALNDFFMETPGCAGTPVSFTPTQSAKVANGGIVWESSIATTDSSKYSITYNGNLLVGAVNVRIDAGTTTDTKEVQGPCKGIHTISGAVYVDANSDQQMEGSESGIGNVTVSLTTPGGQVYTNKTSYNGEFSFSVFTNNDPTNFTIEVPSSTSDTTDFNEQLFNSYTATSPAGQTVTVDTTDVTGTDFGFAPQTQKMIQEFQNGTIQLTTEAPKFWIKQLRYAKNNNNNAVISRDTLISYLNDIEGLLLKYPFQFGADKIDSALNILTHPTKTDLDKLLVQLLTAELNVVSGRGSNSPEFNLTLLAYGESVAAQSGAAPSVSASAITTFSLTTTTSTSSAYNLLYSFNYSGGGGGGN